MYYEITAQEEALSNFTNLFNLPLLATHVKEDGSVLRIRVNLDTVAARYLLHANYIISANKLPLTADIEEWKVKGVIFGRWLQIKFDQTKLLASCY